MSGSPRKTDMVVGGRNGQTKRSSTNAQSLHVQMAPWHRNRDWEAAGVEGDG
jgi:hypothetical protein